LPTLNRTLCTRGYNLFVQTASGKRGSSKIFGDGELAAAMRAMEGGVLADGPKGRRQAQNRLYAFRAMERLGLLGGDEALAEALADRPSLRWLADEGGARWGILAELGRIKDPEQFDAAVGWVLEWRPKTKEAVAQIRRLRIGKSKPPDTEELAEGIVRAVNDYAIRHPGLTPGQILGALRLAGGRLAGSAHESET
jgi:hypothetical protein